MHTVVFCVPFIDLPHADDDVARLPLSLDRIIFYEKHSMWRVVAIYIQERKKRVSFDLQSVRPRFALQSARAQPIALVDVWWLVGGGLYIVHIAHKHTHHVHTCWHSIHRHIHTK